MEILALAWPVIGWTFLVMHLENHEQYLERKYPQSFTPTPLEEFFMVGLCGTVFGPVAIIIWALDVGIER